MVTFDSLSQEELERLDKEGIGDLLKKDTYRYEHGLFASSERKELLQQIEEYKKMLEYINPDC